MRFRKMHGAGNDFILINNMTEHIPYNILRPLARAICRRHFGIGADGLIVLERPIEGGDFRMLFYNSDGSTAQMCGNGVRCAARYGYDLGLSKEHPRIETTAGIVPCQRICKDKYKVELNTPTVAKKELFNFQGRAVGYVELGNPGIPHGVIEDKSLHIKPYVDLAMQEFKFIRAIGQRLRWDGHFKEGANINFYNIKEDGNVFLATFERGVEDFTLSCGTGTGALAVILYMQGRLPKGRCQVISAGGSMDAEVLEASGEMHVFLTGAAVSVYDGDFDIFFKS